MAKHKNNKEDLPGLEGEAPAVRARPVIPPAYREDKRFEFRLLPRSKKEWFFTVFGGLVAVLVVVLAVPYSRYGLVGQFVKRPVTIDVLDSRTGKPVSDVEVSINSQKLKTDSKGEVKVAKVPVGSWQVTASKKYYNLQTTNVMVPLFGSTKTVRLSLVAIGNQVTVKVTNKISGKPLAKAVVVALGTTATTDEKGEAVLVLPVASKGVKGSLKHDGFNDLAVTIANTETETAGNAFALTPSGRIYFLSKRSGKISVMKSDLDGGNASVVLAGTGRESDSDTVLLASRDWKYLVLKAQRDSDQAKLYLLETASDKLSVIDQGNITFSLTGWINDDFVYTVDRPKAIAGTYGQTALKAFRASSGHITLIDQTDGQDVGNNAFILSNIASPYLIDEKVIYTKFWDRFGYYVPNEVLSGKSQVFVSVAPDGSSKQTLSTFSATDYQWVTTFSAKPDSVQYQVGGFDASGNQKPKAYYQFQGGALKAASGVNDANFGQGFSPAFLLSPGGNQTLWYEPRDGKNTLFIGDENGGGAKQIATLSEYTPYGWFSDDYVLVSKKGSELYIAPADFSTAPVKITDYHKPTNPYGGGGGYSG